MSPNFLLVDAEPEKQMFTILMVHRGRPPVALTDKYESSRTEAWHCEKAVSSFGTSLIMKAF